MTRRNMDNFDEPTQHELRLTFDKLQDYVKHEDNLINQRLTWNITIQAFAVTTYGFSIQKKIEVYGKIFEGCKLPIAQQTLQECAAQPLIAQLGKIDQFLIGLACSGILMNIVALLGIQAAHQAIGNLNSLWNAWDQQNNKGKTVSRSGLPGLTGGGIDVATQSGKRTSTNLPYLLIFMWLFAVFFSVSLSSPN